MCSRRISSSSSRNRTKCAGVVGIGARTSSSISASTEPEAFVGLTPLSI